MGWRDRLSDIRALFASLSLPTRLILLGYLLYVPLSWAFGVAPGEIAFGSPTVISLVEPWNQVTTIVRVDDRTALMGVRGEGESPDLWVVDLDALASEDFERARLITVPGAGRPHSATPDDGRLRILTTTADGQRHGVIVDLEEGTSKMEEVPQTTLWLLPEPHDTATYMLTDFLLDGAFPGHIANEPAIVSGELALVRAAAPGGKTDEHGAWVELPPTSDDDVYLFDAYSTEPLGYFDTVALSDISPYPARSGFFYLEHGSGTMVWCPEERETCKWGSLHVRTQSYPIRAVDARGDVHRVAVCTDEEVYLYEGDPPDDEIVFLGRAPVLGCTDLIIAGPRRVLVSGTEQPLWVTFEAVGQ